jgi:hypothetical protein
MMTRTAIKQVEARNRYFEWAKEWVLTDFGAAIYTLNLVVFRASCHSVHRYPDGW